MPGPRKMKLGVLAALLSAGLCLLPPALSQEGKDAPSRKELYKFVWDYVMVGDGDATTDDLRNIASYYDSTKQDVRAKVEETVGSKALSERQKREAVKGFLPGVRYGTVVTRAGETYAGVVVWNFKGDPYAKLELSLSKGGHMDVPLPEVKEVEFAEDGSLTCKRFTGELLHGRSGKILMTTIYRAGCEPVTCEARETKRVILGSLKKASCPECFRTMEIDWKFCPYCGTRLSDGVKWQGSAGK